MSDSTNTCAMGAPPVPPVPSRSLGYQRSGIGLGIGLIAVGAAFIAVRFVPGVYWWGLWPLFVVVAGFVHLVTPGPFERWGMYRVTEAAWIMIAGAVLLGNTTGYVSWNVWWLLFSLWPALLVAAGINLIGKGLQQSWLRAVAPLVVLGALLLAVTLSWSGGAGALPVEWRLPVQEWSGSHVDIRLGDGHQPISITSN